MTTTARTRARQRPEPATTARAAEPTPDQIAEYNRLVAIGDQLVEPTTTPDISRCVCHKPTLIATFRREQLVALELRHLRSAGCAYPTQAIDVDTWRKPW